MNNKFNVKKITWLFSFLFALAATTQAQQTIAASGKQTAETIDKIVNSEQTGAKGVVNQGVQDPLFFTPIPVVNPFITTWKTNNAGATGSNVVYIPTSGTGYNYDVDWNNDGTYDQFGVTGSTTHAYTTAGTYTIAIKGSFPRIYFNNEFDKLKILSVENWGNIAWTSMNKAFYGCSNLVVNATDTPNLSAVTDMSFMFANAAAFNQNISAWSVGSVTNMNDMFAEATAFNQNISAWSVGSVTKMSEMFFGATAFNQNIGAWNVSSVKDMSNMFYNATVFNQNIGTWNVGSVTNMSGMLFGATAFNQNIGAWNVSSVINMSSMFYRTTSFDQNIGTWNVSNVKSMSNMFYAAAAFNQNIGTWNVGNVKNISNMFGAATSFNQNIGAWNVSNVTNMNNVFAGASAFNQNIGAWNVANVQYMNTMFLNATSFNQDISGWNVSSVKGMNSMFQSATSFNQNISGWNVGSVTGMNAMFNSATAFNQNIAGWNVSSVTDMSYMFNGATAFNQNIGGWNVSSVVDMSYMFLNATAFNQNIGTWNISGVTDMPLIFYFSGISQPTYDSILTAWNNAGYTNKNLDDVSPLKYCTATAARASLITKGWTITGDALLCPCTPTAETFTTSACGSYTWVANNNKVYTASNNTDTIHQINAGGCDNLVTLNLTINPLPNAGTINGANSLCSNGATNLTSNGDAGGTWSSDSTTATVNSSGAVVGVSAGSATISYAVTNGCGTATATFPVTVVQATQITVQPPSVSAVCAGSGISEPLTAIGVNLSYQWQSSTNGGSSYSNISNGGIYSGTQTATLTISNVSSSDNGTKHRCVVSGSCGTATSLGKTLTVTTPTIPSFTQVAAICLGASLSALPTTSTNAITGTWSPALDNTATTTYTFTPTTGLCATTATMTIVVTPSTENTTTVTACDSYTWNGTVYTTSGIKTGTTTNCVTEKLNLTIISPILPTFTQVAAICSGASLSALPTTSSNGVAGTWSPALNNLATTTYTFTPSAGVCATTATMTIVVRTAGTITGGNITVCAAGTALNANGVSTVFTNSTTLTLNGNSAGSTIQWQKSLNFVNATNATPVWSTVTNVTATNNSVQINGNTLTASNSITTVWYRAKVTNGLCVTFSEPSKIAVNPLAKSGGIISLPSVCLGGNISFKTTAYTGSSIAWEVSTTSATAGFSTVVGANELIFTMNNVSYSSSSKFYVRCVVKSGDCTIARSAASTINVNPNSVAGTVIGAGTYCAGSNATLKISTYTGKLQWVYSLDGINFINVPTGSAIAPTFATTSTSAATSSYAVNNITGKTFFKAIVQNGACSTSESNVVVFNTATTATAPSLSVESAQICSGSATSLYLPLNVGDLKFQKSNNWSSATPTWTNVNLQMTQILYNGAYGAFSTETLTQSTAYRVVSSIGSCAPVVYSSIAVIGVQVCAVVRAIETPLAIKIPFEVIAYPNPSNNVFNFKVNGADDETVSILVYDMTGRQVDNKVVKANDIENLALGQNYASGVYNVIVSQGMNTKTVRLVKQ